MAMCVQRNIDSAAARSPCKRWPCVSRGISTRQPQGPPERDGHVSPREYRLGSRKVPLKEMAMWVQENHTPMTGRHIRNEALHT
eukprot:366333-Chlamydomonas_euryale.AAC.6